MQKSIALFCFSALDQKHHLGVNLVQKIKLVSLSWNLVPRLIPTHVELNGDVHFFVLDQKHTFWANLAPKFQNCLFKLKFRTSTNSNMQKSMALFNFSALDQKHHLGVNLVQKIKLVSLSWNLVPRLIPTCRIQWRCSLFCFGSETHFWANLAPKIKLLV